MNLVVFGLGYTARAFVDRVGGRFDEVVATRRDAKIGTPARSFPLVGKVVPSEEEGRMGVHPRTPTSKQAAPPPPRSNALRSLGPPHKGEGRREPTNETSESPSRADGETAASVTTRAFPGDEAALAADVAEADAILVSIPPDPAAPAPHDPVLAAFGEAIRAAPKLRWLGYLSTIGVYGDHGGAWVDEATPPRPVSRRSVARLATEEAWLDLAAAGVPVHLFRLAGIYGPGRSAFDKLAAGTAKRIVKPGQVFNRIHVDDIACVLEASLERPRSGAVYNVADDEPAPPQDVIAEAARLAGLPLPPEIAYDEAGMSPMAASFWGETKRVSNRLLHDELGVRLLYPTYREGLRGIMPPRGSPSA